MQFHHFRRLNHRPGRRLRAPGSRPGVAGGQIAAAGALALVLVAAGRAHAGPWVQSRAGYFAKFSASYLYTTSEFDSHGDEVPILTSNPLVRSAAYREVDLSTYVEYGLLDRITVVGSLPFKIATSRRTEISTDATVIREIDVTNAGLSDLFLGARTALHRGPFPAAVEAGVKIPLGYERVPENGGPALGTGDPDGWVALLAGFGAASVYTSARVGYRVRGGDLDDEIGFGVDLGARRGRAFGQVVVEGSYTTGDIETLDVSSTTVVPNQDVLKLVVTAGARTGEHASVFAELYHMLDGRNTATGTTVAVGLVFAR